MTDFVATQNAFTAHIKDPDNNRFDYGIEDRRMQVYRELFFNNILGFLNSGFPVLHSLYNEAEWQSLARQFFAQHHCRSPYFIDISKEFVEFLSNEYQPTESDPVFLRDLAHYEWIELAISVKKSDQNFIAIEDNRGFSSVVMSELAILLSYQFPVHQIKSDYQPSQPGETVFIVVYRNASDEVNFTLVNAVSAHLLHYISERGISSLESITQEMIKALPQLDEQQVAEATTDTINQFVAQQILLPVFD